LYCQNNTHDPGGVTPGIYFFRCLRKTRNGTLDGKGNRVFHKRKGGKSGEALGAGQLKERVPDTLALTQRATSSYRLTGGREGKEDTERSEAELHPRNP